MAGKNWEKLNPGSVDNWGQVEMIYGLRNVLVTLSSKQQHQLGSAAVRVRSKWWFSRKLEIAHGKPVGKGRVVGRWGHIWSTKSGITVSPTLLTSKSWFIRGEIARNGSMPRKFHLSGIWEEKKNQRKVGFVLVGMSLCSLSQLVLASQAHWNSIKCFCTTREPWAWFQVRELCNATHDPAQQEPSAGSPMLFAMYLKSTSFFSWWALE